MKLHNQTFIITGASSGMGKAIALEFAHQGAHLVLSGRSEEKGNELVSAIQKRGGHSFYFPGNVNDPDYNKLLVMEAEKKFGKLDGVVCNAGMLGLGKLTVLDKETWRETFGTNVDAAFFLLRQALPVMEKNTRGVVILNASIAAFKSFPEHPAYCASKAALVALGKQLALDYAPHIRVNSICPGPVDTPLLHDSAVAFPEPDKALENAEKATLLKRLGQPQDVAKLALFLASEDASWITGSVFTIDGGIMARS
ncbi:SDR family NAD(P)-dependent oxidoreductase [Pararhodonellum marinum]|uniref:SDR family NAD(P)-dependent oxidoreductase n=1 Tax=Pararhodonellum marinum TaxID=2755358 RepID=UPI00188F721C|nr:SDR family oxidoreductase [Pararhodonellum marinum]